MDKITILVVEDEPTINRIISKYFLEENYIVLNAYDGEKGLELFNENKVDLVCLDHHLAFYLLLLLIIFI